MSWNFIESSLLVWHKAINASQHAVAATTNRTALWVLVTRILLFIYIEFARCRLLATNRPHFVVIWMWQMRNSFVSTKTPLGTSQYYTITALFPVQSQPNQHGTHREPWVSRVPLCQWRWQRDNVKCTKLWNLRYLYFRYWKRCLRLLNSLA